MRFVRSLAYVPNITTAVVKSIAVLRLRLVCFLIYTTNITDRYIIIMAIGVTVVT